MLAALAALISATQTEEKFFTTFLFKENPAKAERLFDNLIDASREYPMPTVLDQPLSVHTERLSALHAINPTTPALPSTSTAFDGHARRRMLVSQLLAGSSLGAVSLEIDARQNHINNVTEGDQSTDEKGMAMGVKMLHQVSEVSAHAAEDPTITLAVPDTQVYELNEHDFELDAWNTHECMATLLGLIDRLHALQQPLLAVAAVASAANTGNTVVPAMPAWQAQLLAKIQHDETSKNVKLFIAKIVTNRPDAFEPWAGDWFRPLIQQTLVAGDTPEGPVFNYMVTDLCITLLSWARSAIPGEIDAYHVRKLLEFLFANARHEKGPVLKNNVTIIRLLLEKWRPRVRTCIPYHTIFRNFASPDVVSKWNLCGIHLLSAVVANDFSPFDPHCGDTQTLTHGQFYETLSQNLFHKSVQVYRAAAAVLGMCLQTLEVNKDDSLVCVHFIFNFNFTDPFK